MGAVVEVSPVFSPDVLYSPTSPPDNTFGNPLAATTSAPTLTTGHMLPPSAHSALLTNQYAPPTWQVSEGMSLLHQQMIETANKRISTLDYLRKA